MNGAMADDIGKLLLRVVLAVLILFHGVGKLIGGIDGIASMVEGVGLPRFFSYGVFLGEVLGPILLLVGWYARIGAALIVINMLFAIGLAHRGELFTLAETGAWALELQGMFLFTALALALTGPGRLGVNQR